MSVITPLKSLEEQIEEEHRQIGEMFEVIRSTMAGGRQNLPLVRKQLHELTELLMAHFEHEEEGGYFAEVNEMAPHLTTAVDTLRDEHLTLLQNVLELRKNVNSAPDAGLWWRAIRFDFEMFYRRCKQHELDEQFLLQDAYTQDLAAVD